MKAYTVTVEETVSQDFAIEADSPEEAVKKARQLYGRGELVVDGPQLEGADFFYFPEDGSGEDRVSLVNGTLIRGGKERL